MADKPEPDIKQPETIAQVYARSNPDEREQIMQHLLGLFEHLHVLLTQLTTVSGTVASLLEVVGVREDLVGEIHRRGRAEAESVAHTLECGDIVHIDGEEHEGQPYFERDCVVDEIDEVNDTIRFIHENAFHSVPLAHARLVKKKGS